MKKMIIAIVIALMFLNSYVSYAQSSNPGGGEFSFEMKKGFSDVDMGDVIFSLPQGLKLMKFTSAGGLKEDPDALGFYGIVSKDGGIEDSKDNQYYYFSYVRCGYVNNLSLTPDNLKDILGNLSEAKLGRIPTLMSAAEKKGYIISMLDEALNETSFLGVFPGRHGIACIGSSFKDQTNAAKNLMQFTSMTNAIAYKKGEQYQDFIEGKDPVYSKDLKSYLVNVLKDDSQSILGNSSTELQDKNNTRGLEAKTPGNVQKIPGKYGNALAKSDNTYTPEIKTSSNKMPEQNAKSGKPGENGSDGRINWILIMGVLIIISGLFKRLSQFFKERNQIKSEDRGRYDDDDANEN